MATSIGMAQDAVWCDLCPSNQFLKTSAELHCKSCSTNLCQDCARQHLILKSSTKHDIVEYKHRTKKPNYKECHTHLGWKRVVQCQQCQLQVCAMCLSDSHKGHVTEISTFTNSKIVQIIQDTEELEKYIAHEYEKEDSQIGTTMSEKSQKYNVLITSLAKHGQDWHKEVDTIINKHTATVQNDKREDLGHLQKYRSKIRNTKSHIYQTIETNKNILKLNDITEMAKYRSRNDEFKRIPPRAEFSLPSFQPIKIQGDELLRQFGTLSASIKSEVEGYTIKIAEHMSSVLSLKHLLDKSQVIFTINSGNEYLRRMSCMGSDQVWISGNDQTLKCLSNHGELLNVVTHVCRSAYPEGLSVIGDGDVLYCDPYDTSVKMVQDKNIQTMIAMQDWVPCAVCATISGDILVLTIKKGNVKLVRYSGSVEKQEIQHDHNGQPLFSDSLYFRYIDENRNEDICVQNDDNIVVVNQSGLLRFMYDGKHSANKYKTFNPRGIATDSNCQILVADIDNNCVHVINKDGKFLCYIDNCDLVQPFPISVDSQDRLWVGCYYTSKIKVIRYM